MITKIIPQESFPVMIMHRHCTNEDTWPEVSLPNKKARNLHAILEHALKTFWPSAFSCRQHGRLFRNRWFCIVFPAFVGCKTMRATLSYLYLVCIRQATGCPASQICLLYQANSAQDIELEQETTREQDGELHVG